MIATRPLEAARQVQVYLQTADLLGASTSRVAEVFNVSPTTLGRRLHRAGTTFQNLLEEERRRRLHQIARRGQIVPKRDAALLGYQHVNNFYNAFKREFGIGVREHKNQEKKRVKLPDDNYAVLAMVKSMLRNADLTDCRRKTVEAVIGAPFPTIRHRLTLVGTTWEALKTQERVRRIEQLLGAPGKLNPQVAAKVVGFREVNSFYRFFTEQMGMTYTDWRMQRQVA